jgi:DNA-binding response OmpR family regulator
MANLLIIDDDVPASAALAALLRREGHQVTCAPSAGEALSRLRQADPDLVLLDLTMPRVDGLDLFEALSEEPRFQGLRVAIYSGRDEPGAVDTARRLGACDYILKGGDWGQTYDRIKACLGGEQMASPPLA